MHRLLCCVLYQQAFVSLQSNETEYILGVLFGLRESRQIEQHIQPKTLLGMSVDSNADLLSRLLYHC